MTPIPATARSAIKEAEPKIEPPQPKPLTGEELLLDEELEASEEAGASLEDGTTLEDGASLEEGSLDDGTALLDEDGSSGGTTSALAT